MAETEEQRQQRLLDELKGKNVAHYSVMLAAYINTSVDATKAVFVFSSTGIGLLIAIAAKLQQLSICVKIVYIGALVAFFAAVCSTVLVHIRNTKAIESYIRSEGKEKYMDYKLNTWKYINYFSFAIGLALSLVFTIVGIFNSNKLSETGAANPVVKEVRAHRFIIEDENGKPRGALAVTKEGPMLTLSDENGKLRTVLSVDEYGSRLGLRDERGKLRAVLSAEKDRSMLGMSDENEILRAGFAVTKDGPGLGLSDESGKIIWEIP
jgi:hypothetical protein